CEEAAGICEDLKLDQNQSVQMQLGNVHVRLPRPAEKRGADIRPNSWRTDCQSALHWTRVPIQRSALFPRLVRLDRRSMVVKDSAGGGTVVGPRARLAWG